MSMRYVSTVFQNVDLRAVQVLLTHHDGSEISYIYVQLYKLKREAC